MCAPLCTSMMCVVQPYISAGTLYYTSFSQRVQQFPIGFDEAYLDMRNHHIV